MFELLDNFFRFGAVTCCIFVAMLVWRDTRHSLPARLAIFAAISDAAYLLCYWPGIAAATGAGMMLLLVVCLLSPPAIWYFSLSLFHDTFKLRWGHYAIGIGFYLLGISQYVQYYLHTGDLPLMSPTVFHAAMRELDTVSWVTSVVLLVMKAGLVVHLLAVAWAGRHDDLVEERRRFRFVFVTTVSVVFSFMIATENWLVTNDPAMTAMFRSFQSGSVLAILFYMLWHLTRLEGEWVFGRETEKSQPLTKPVAQDRHDLLILEKLVQSDALFEQGMTINNLAKAANMPEHRLRRIVNQHLGYRNFSDYLNHHRVEAAKFKLSDIGDRHVPVLTVAMTLGYGSLGPFNRAFKERAGMTPTEFRKKALADY